MHCHSVNVDGCAFLEVARFIRAMEFPPFDGAAVLVDGKRLLVDSVEEISDGLPGQSRRTLPHRFEAYRSLMRGAGAAPVA